MKWGLHLCFALALVAPRSSPVQTATQATLPEHHLEVPGSQPWTDTGIDVQAGQTVNIAATGNLHYMDGSAPGPEGLPRTWRDLIRSLPVNSAGRGALIARIGSDDAAQPFLVGAKLNFPVRVSGRLFLGINGPSGDSGEGSFQVTIAVEPFSSSAPSTQTGAASGLASAPPKVPASTSGAIPTTPAAKITAGETLPPGLLAQIPRRVTDKDGNPGDMVNFLMVGTEDQMKAAFQAGGWVPVDRDTTNAVLQALLASLSKQAYLTMPMSELYLFGRPQDYGFAHAEPLTVVTTRHHLRVWKSALTVDGQPVWVGAATHDMGIERDQRNGKLTHHIDPNVDDERTFVQRSLTQTGYIAHQTSVLPSDPVKEARTATGGSFHSNGEILVFWLSR
jgi:LssY C-terminus